MAGRKCRYCPKVFIPRRGQPPQVTCGATACQKARKSANAKSPAGLAASRRGCAKYRATAKGAATRKECQSRLYESKKAAGVCAENGCRRKAKKGRTKCAKHLAADAAASLGYYRRKKEAGVCIAGRCGKPAEPGRTRCAACQAAIRPRTREYQREYYRKRQAKKKKAA